jgi:hypothetical protein
MEQKKMYERNGVQTRRNQNIFTKNNTDFEYITLIILPIATGNIVTAGKRIT